MPATTKLSDNSVMKALSCLLAEDVRLGTQFPCRKLSASCPRELVFFKSYQGDLHIYTKSVYAAGTLFHSFGHAPVLQISKVRVRMNFM